MTTINREVLEILSTGTVEGNLFRLTCGQLDRKKYEAVNKVLDILGGKWNRKAGGHLFALTAEGIIDQAILTGEVGNKNPLEFFETPLTLAKQMVELAELTRPMSILEPSAGRGAIVDAVPDELRAGVDMIEFDPQRRTYLQGKYGRECIAEDFLTFQPARPYDRILMNPPFSRGQDVAHITRAYSMLAPAGMLVAIAANSVTFRQERRYQEFRSLVESCGRMETNPDESFRASGTCVNTVTVVLGKCGGS